MALGKAGKIARNYQVFFNTKIQPKLDNKLLSDDFYKELKNKDVPSELKFKLFIYNHEAAKGLERTKKEWIEWLDILRGKEVVDV